MGHWSERLREERMRAELSQDQLAQKVGITRKSQQRYESGDTAPDIAYLEAIELLGLDSQYVLNGRRVGEIGIAKAAIQKGAAAAFEMVRNSGIPVSPDQFAQMLVTLLGSSTQGADEKAAGSAKATESTGIGHNFVATGNGNVQVGGHIRVKRPRKVGGE